MGDAKNVKKLAADAAARAAASKKTKESPTVAKRMRLRGKDKKAKGKPSAVLKLITEALDRKGKR